MNSVFSKFLCDFCKFIPEFFLTSIPIILPSFHKLRNYLCVLFFIICTSSTKKQLDSEAFSATVIRYGAISKT